MSKFFVFAFLWWLTGSPFIALLVILVLLYFLDRRFIGLLPSIARPFRLNGRLSRIRQELALNPHNTSNKLEAARILIEKKRYAAALPYLQEIAPIMDESAEVLYELGWCRLKTGDPEKGEALILQALRINPKVRYGEPYLRLGEALARLQTDKALHYLEQFKTVQSSSCEAYYRLGQIYGQLGEEDKASRAFREAIEIYKSLPKYKRKEERRWALLAVFRKK